MAILQGRRSSMGEPKRSLDSILEQAVEKYGSLSSPEFFFVRKALDEDPFRGLIDELASDFQIEEDTDPNDDVSFGYLLTKDSKQWVLRISMVGPYAALFRMKRNGGGEVVEESSNVYVEERNIIQLVKQASIQFLTQAELEQPVEMNLSNTEPENVKIYQVLFSDTDFLPWSL
jgi:hypothetical protein